ncbi:MAG: TolC family protein [Thermodesulfobacteriota bacterium]
MEESGSRNMSSNITKRMREWLSSVEAKGHLLSAFILVVSLLTAAMPAYAEERAVTLDDAYRMALSNHELVKIAGEDLLQARAGLSKATSQLLPTVTADGNITRFSEQQSSGGFLLQPDETRNFSLRVRQPLFEGGRRWRGRKQARLSLDGSRVGVKATREEVMADTGRAFFNTLKAERDLEISEASMKRALERRKVASSRLKVGEVTRSVLLRAEADVAGAEADLITAKNRLIDGKDLLKRLIGAKGEIAVVEPPLHSPSVESGEELIAKALKGRRDYRQAMIAEEISHEEVKSAWGSFLPTLTLEGLYTNREQEPSTTFLLNDSVSASLVLSYPLFEGGLRRAELREAKSLRRGAELRRMSLRKDIELEVRAALHAVESLNAVTESFARQVAFSEENYEMVFKQFKYGLATNVDVIDADSTLVAAQSGLMNARYDLQIALLDLKFAVGTLLDEWEGKNYRDFAADPMSGGRQWPIK